MGTFKQKKFTMIDEEFECCVCGTSVKKLNYTARDHCNVCLCSLHVDVFPGDRMCECHGILSPIGIEKYKNTYKIVYECNKCNKRKRNIVAIDDDIDKIIELSSQVFSTD